MLSRLEIELETEDKDSMSYYKAEILQSILMEQINQEYAANLHISGLHPYSQSVTNYNNKNIWNISVTNAEAYHEIIEPLKKDTFLNFQMKHDNWNVKIIEKKEKTIEKEAFIDKYLTEDTDRYFHVGFMTPTAFKSQGKYVFYPDLHLIYQSLINKFDASSENISLKNEEILEQMIEYSYVTKYQLRSTTYSVGLTKIPSFIGDMVIKVNGPQQMANFVNLLFHFGEYSGLGIKTAMGMGNIRLLRKEKR